MADMPAEFRPVCRYTVRNGEAVDLEVVNHALWNARDVVFAHVCGDSREPVYISKTDRTLCQRVKEHFDLIATAKNARFRSWAEGKQMTILAHQPALIEGALGNNIAHLILKTKMVARHCPKPLETRPWFGRQR